MCGIIGLLNANSLNSVGSRSVSYMPSGEELMTSGLVACSIRGMDSTGVFQINGNGKVYLHKLPLNASTFIQDKVAKVFLKDAVTSPITVFHTRAATEGRININNAHPFTALSVKDKKLVGVHNGTLTGWRTAKGATRYEVDSEWAINRLAQDPFDAFEDFRGAWSFVYWKEEQPSVLYFARNKERPMWILFTKNRKHAIFGSEPGMLSWIAQRTAHVDVEDTVYELPPDHAFIIDTAADKLEIKHAFKEALPQPKVTTSSSDTNYSQSTTWRDTRKDSLSAAMATILSEAAASFSGKCSTTSAAAQQALAEIPFEAGEIAPLTEDMFDFGVADDNERKRARDEGLYGQVVAFTPITVHKNSVVGTITVLRGENDIAEADAFLRHGVGDLTLDNIMDQFGWVAIAGMYTVKDVVVYVLAPLNEAGEAMIAEEVAAYVGEEERSDHS